LHLGPKNGQSTGKVMMRDTDSTGHSDGTRDIESCAPLPRLMNLHDAADYLGLAIGLCATTSLTLDSARQSALFSSSQDRRSGRAPRRDIEAEESMWIEPILMR